MKSNSNPLGYFGLKSKDLPRIGIYDGDSDMKWLLPEGDISTKRVREFCQSFLNGELKVSKGLIKRSVIRKKKSPFNGKWIWVLMCLMSLIWFDVQLYKIQNPKNNKDMTFYYAVYSCRAVS